MVPGAKIFTFRCHFDNFFTEIRFKPVVLTSSIALAADENKRNTVTGTSINHLGSLLPLTTYRLVLIWRI